MSIGQFVTIKNNSFLRGALLKTALETLLGIIAQNGNNAFVCLYLSESYAFLKFATGTEKILSLLHNFQ